MTRIDAANTIKAYMDSNQAACLSDVCRATGTSPYMVRKLAEEGLIKMPIKLTKSQGATKGRKLSGRGSHFYINKPAPWQMK